MEDVIEGHRIVKFLVRVPEPIVKHADCIAHRAGLSRAQLIRVLLSDVTDQDIPASFFEHATALRARS